MTTIADPLPPTQVIDWDRRYREGATHWERPGINPALLAWRESGALSPCRILVPGAGRSTEPLVLAEAGFDVTVVDAAPTAVAAQRGRLAHLHVRARVEFADLFAWQPPEAFDAIYDQTCLCALPPPLLPDYAARLHAWLKPGGRLFVLFMQTGQAGGPPFHCDMDAMRRLFAPASWLWPDHLGEKFLLDSGRSEQPAILRPR
jgi:trans-aconitate methyltransferase